MAIARKTNQTMEAENEKGEQSGSQEVERAKLAALELAEHLKRTCAGATMLSVRLHGVDVIVEVRYADALFTGTYKAN